MRRRIALLALTLAAALVAPAAAPARPNVVVIETDDQTVDDLTAMPHTRALIGDAGVSFAASVVSLSQCCPSRATLLTGRYAHNHGVLSVSPPFGGVARLDASETLAVWLQRSGYATALVGKYLNGYGRGGRAEVPPGWTEWHALLGGSTYRYYGYTISHDGRTRTYGSAPADYQTDVLTGLAVDVVRRRASARRPFFLWLNYVAPHSGGPRELLDPAGTRSPVAAPRHRHALVSGSPLQDPAFNEADVADKPRRIARRPRLGPARVSAVRDTWEQRRRSLLAVDEGVARIAQALRQRGELEDTLLLFTSDNGFLTGQHRVMAGKVLPYEPSIRVPLLLRGPGLPRGQVRRDLVWNGDIAPTIMQAARARAPWPLDGRSLLPLARGASVRPGRAVVIEGPPRTRSSLVPRFVGLRTSRWLYVEHAWGQRELYALRGDPAELRNLATVRAAAPRRRALARRLARLRSCAGRSCR